ncbi:lanthionine synthetase LanC family protein [Pseudomonas sp. TWI929]|uniref:lanthionine synthetase LanC family protein n=1 Tax=Pseudomonas sp. TWI929 TaxID=3136795 RepID=UPI00320A8269
MDISTRFVLQPDVLIFSVSEVALDVRASVSFDANDFVVTRVRSRMRSQVVDQNTAEFLKVFLQPTTVTDAVLKKWKEEGGDPEAILDSAMAAIKPLVRARWLVPEGAEDYGRVASSLGIGDEFGTWTIVDCIQVLDDCEVYQLHDASNCYAALKIAQLGIPKENLRALRREANILEHLDLSVAPRLIARGEHDERPYLITEWCDGTRVDRTAAELRESAPKSGTGRLMQLCCRIIDAYRRLHGEGVVHGDIHPNNIVMHPDGRIQLIDYGSAGIVGSSEHAPLPYRGIAEFFDPEYAAACLNGVPIPPSTFQSEQYALAALLFRLLTGASYLALPTTRDEALQAITEHLPRQFSSCGLPSWPELEQVLGKALHKDPALRFASVADFDAAFASIAPKPPGGAHGRKCNWPTVDTGLSLDALCTADVLTFRLPDGAPSASINYGAAGIAFALLSGAEHQNSEALLAAADAWSARAVDSMARANAFAHAGIGLGEDTIEPISLYFSKPGVYFVRALVAQSMGDYHSLRGAVTEFIAVAGLANESVEVNLGRGGVLLGTALMLDALGQGGVQLEINSVSANLVSFGRVMAREIWSRLVVLSSQNGHYLGIAHGLAGICYSLVLWSEVSGDPLPGGFLGLVERLGHSGREAGRGLRWPMIDVALGKAGERFMSSWCHGAPGYVHLWTALYRRTNDDRWLELSARAAWSTWETPEDNVGTLCCGSAGRTYALLAHFRHSGETAWLDRAFVIARQAIESRHDKELNFALFKGRLGCLFLAEDMNTPERASFPIFERAIRG